jgi:RNA polymerase sigma-70 factor (ECF subfamily)
MVCPPTPRDALAGEKPAEPIIRALLDRSYPRLLQPPVNSQPDELLSGVVERLLKAMREVHPQIVH